MSLRADTKNALNQQMVEKLDKRQNDQYGGYYQDQGDFNPSPLQENAYYKNKQKGTGCGYNILTGV